jgi:predicted O-methyltransferase YrrM
MFSRNVHPNFCEVVREIERAVSDVPGWLSARDIRFLAMVAAHPCAAGEILEIGAFRGKSAIVLAKASELVGQERVYSCDPLNCHHPADHPASVVIRQEFDRNLLRNRVGERVAFHQVYSHELAKTWTRPIRMLWIDGDHSLTGVRQDLDDFSPFLTDGAIVAMHDVLTTSDGVARVFVEDVLASPHYGLAGVHGNIAWAQYRSDVADTVRFQRHKRKLAARLQPLIPIQTIAAGGAVHGFDRLRYRYLRWRAKSRSMRPESWLKQVA